MQNLERRDWIKKSFGALGVMALGRHSAIAEEYAGQSPACHGGAQFWEKVDEIHAHDLVAGALRAAKEQVEYSRASSASKRAEILLGRGAGQEYEAKAELHFRARAAELRILNESLSRFVESIDEGKRKKASQFFGAGATKEVTAHARQSAVLRLLNSDTTPEEARTAIETLGSTLQRIEALRSFDETTAYLAEHLDELSGKKMGNPSIPQGLCILILLLTSVFAVLVLIAVLICALSLGLACQGVLDRLLDDACPP